MDNVITCYLYYSGLVLLATALWIGWVFSKPRKGTQDDQ